MDAMEDLLQPKVAKDGFATLALVSTGEHLREWIYHCKDEDEFMLRLNKALGGTPRFQIQVLLAGDEQWESYGDFKNGLAK